MAFSLRPDKTVFCTNETDYCSEVTLHYRLRPSCLVYDFSCVCNYPLGECPRHLYPFKMQCPEYSCERRKNVISHDILVWLIPLLVVIVIFIAALIWWIVKKRRNRRRLNAAATEESRSLSSEEGGAAGGADGANEGAGGGADGANGADAADGADGANVRFRPSERTTRSAVDERIAQLQREQQYLRRKEKQLRQKLAEREAREAKEKERPAKTFSAAIKVIRSCMPAAKAAGEAAIAREEESKREASSSVPNAASGAIPKQRPAGGEGDVGDANGDSAAAAMAAAAPTEQLTASGCSPTSDPSGLNTDEENEAKDEAKKEKPYLRKLASRFTRRCRIAYLQMGMRGLFVPLPQDRPNLEGQHGSLSENTSKRTTLTEMGDFDRAKVYSFDDFTEEDVRNAGDGGAVQPAQDAGDGAVGGAVQPGALGGHDTGEVQVIDASEDQVVERGEDPLRLRRVEKLERLKQKTEAAFQSGDIQKMYKYKAKLDTYTEDCIENADFDRIDLSSEESDDEENTPDVLRVKGVKGEKQ